jgi:hypothetical protein
MDTKLAENGLLLSDFVLRNISFSPEYAASVEQKQIAEQTAQQARFVVEQRRQEADQAREVAKGKADAAVTEATGQATSRIIQAEAEAKSLELIANVLKENPDLLTYQYISKLSPNVQVMFLPSNTPFLFPLPEMGPDVPQQVISQPAVPVRRWSQLRPSLKSISMSGRWASGYVPLAHLFSILTLILQSPAYRDPWNSCTQITNICLFSFHYSPLSSPAIIQA